MSMVFKQKYISISPKLFCSESPPQKIVYNQDEPAKIILQNGEAVTGSCLNCPDTPCLKYQEEELVNNSFPSFPQDKILNVCPTEAIILDADTGSPTIDSSRCIACGLCASRCPIGAIYFKEQLITPSYAEEKIKEPVAIINTNSSNYIKDIEQDIGNKLLEKINNKKALLKSLPREGALINESDKIFTKIYRKIVNISVDAQFPNILSRNLLLQTGISCSIRRKGDVNLRMDAVLGSYGASGGVLEIELTLSGILDSPRNILDNIAVLNSRYDASIKTLTPLIISMSLPNYRTEYYRVIKDINNVLDIKINSLTIGALFIFVWNNTLLKLEDLSFYVDTEKLSIRCYVEKKLGRKINLSKGICSILESSK